MKREWLESLRPAVSLVALFTLLTGVVYPLLIWTATHDIFAWEAEGSLLSDRGRIVGSRLIGQPFSEPRYLWGRLSATGVRTVLVVPLHCSVRSKLVKLAGRCRVGGTSSAAAMRQAASGTAGRCIGPAPAAAHSSSRVVVS